MWHFLFFLSFLSPPSALICIYFWSTINISISIVVILSLSNYTPRTFRRIIYVILTWLLFLSVIKLSSFLFNGCFLRFFQHSSCFYHFLLLHFIITFAIASFNFSHVATYKKRLTVELLPIKRILGDKAMSLSLLEF